MLLRRRLIVDALGVSKTEARTLSVLYLFYSNWAIAFLISAVKKRKNARRLFGFSLFDVLERPKMRGADAQCGDALAYRNEKSALPPENAPFVLFAD